MTRAPLTGFLSLHGSVEGHYIPPIRDGRPSMVGVTRQDWDRVRTIAEIADPDYTKVFYEVMVPPGWDLWWDELRQMITQDANGDWQGLDAAVDRWWFAAKKDSDSLDDIIGWASSNGHRLVVSGFGEMQGELLRNPQRLTKFAAFEAARTRRLWAAGAMAGVTRWPVGNIYRTGIQATEEAVQFCRPFNDVADEPVAVLIVNEYGAIWPGGWMGPDNQSENVDPQSARQVQIDALFGRTQFDFTDLSQWQPAHLVGRPWGMDNEDGTFGIPELFDVLMMVGEFNVDHIPHVAMPFRKSGEPFTGWWTSKGEMMDQLNLPNEQAVVRWMLDFGDDYYNGFRMADGSLQVPWRMWFGAGPGDDSKEEGVGDWEDFDLFRTEQTARAYYDYSRQEKELGAEVEWWNTNPDLDPDPDPEPGPEGTMVDRLLVAKQQVISIRLVTVESSTQVVVSTSIPKTAIIANIDSVVEELQRLDDAIDKE